MSGYSPEPEWEPELEPEAEPEECDECAWLAEQGRAALLSGDRSREVDIRVLRYRHHQAEHAKQG
jgi:hypothetical protein